MMNHHTSNGSYAVVVQRKRCARRQVSVPSVVHANDLSFKIVYLRWARVHTAVETAVTVPVGM